MAGELDVDLVEIATTANPPVCRLMDYGKFKYQEQKKAAEAKAKQTVIEIKEVKFRPGTDDGDYNIKMRNIRRFLADGDKCKITLRFRGREITHQEIGMALLLALMALDIKPGDEVLCPAFTFFATAGAVSRLGAVPVFTDICPICFNLDVNDARKKITAKTKAIIPVHLFGHSYGGAVAMQLALRWPERELASVPASRVHFEANRPLEDRTR